MDDVEQMAEFATNAMQNGISKFTPTRLKQTLIRVDDIPKHAKKLIRRRDR